jgi:hypothetical protein
MEEKDVSECPRVGIYDVGTQALIAGPIFLNILPRQNDILRIDSIFHQVRLVEVDYKTQDQAKVYVTTIGDEIGYRSVLATLAKP